SRRLFCDRVRQRQGISAVAEEYRDDQDPEPPDQRQPEHRPPEGLEDRHLAPFFAPDTPPGLKTIPTKPGPPAPDRTEFGGSLFPASLRSPSIGGTGTGARPLFQLIAQRWIVL